MKESLLGFLFLAILAAMSWHLAIGLIYAHYFANSPVFVTYWYLPLVVAPALILAVLAFMLGFYRPGGRRGLDVIATLILAAIVILTMPASYSCGGSCM